MIVALTQMLVEPGEKQANLARAESWIGQAAERGAEIVVLPEAMPLGWTHPNVGPITAGPWQGRKCIGNSLVIGADGAEVTRGPYGDGAEALIVQEL